jgi:two-component system CitB family sensor kinase
VLVRDKSGVIELLSELGGAKAYADALTAQHRDHVNRLHLLIGLLQLGSYDEAVEYLTELQRVTPGLAPDPDGAAPVDPSLSALLLGKASIAAERGIAVRFNGITALEELAIDNGSLICVMSNLLDNAMDALAGVLDPRIDIDVSATQDETRLVVRDNGPGIPESTDVFADGFTTKAARGLIHRGLGLALVRHLVLRSGGSVDAHNNAGAVFTVTWPADRDPEQEQW